MTTKAFKMEKVDVLSLEVSRMKAQEVSGQMQLLRMQLNMLQKEMQTRAASHEKLVAELGSKYGVNLSTCQIDVETGEVVPMQPPPNAFARAMNAKAKGDQNQEAASPAADGDKTGEDV